MGRLGCSLGENIKSAAGRLRTFEEAEEFVHDYDDLSRMKVSLSLGGGGWHHHWATFEKTLDFSRACGINESNDLYARLFGVNVPRLTRRDGPMKRPMIPQFLAWTRIKRTWRCQG